MEVKQWCHHAERRYTPPPCHSVVSEKHLGCVHQKSCQEANLTLQVNWWLECLAEKWGENSPWLMSNNNICYRLQEELVPITSLSLFGKCFGIRMLLGCKALHVNKIIWYLLSIISHPCSSPPLDLYTSLLFGALLFLRSHAHPCSCLCHLPFQSINIFGL